MYAARGGHSQVCAACTVHCAAVGWCRQMRVLLLVTTIAWPVATLQMSMCLALLPCCRLCDTS
jgi:hypothetical protein